MLAYGPIAYRTRMPISSLSPILTSPHLFIYFCIHYPHHLSPVSLPVVVPLFPADPSESGAMVPTADMPTLKRAVQLVLFPTASA